MQRVRGIKSARLRRRFKTVLATIAVGNSLSTSNRPARPGPYSQEIRPGRCPDPEIIALRVLMINQAQEVSGRFPASLIYVADREPIAGCPVNPYAASLS